MTARTRHYSSADYVLTGALLADLRVEHPTRFELVVSPRVGRPSASLARDPSCLARTG
jgi:hypothetical protein